MNTLSENITKMENALISIKDCIDILRDAPATSLKTTIDEMENYYDDAMDALSSMLDAREEKRKEEIEKGEKEQARCKLLNQSSGSEKDEELINILARNFYFIKNNLAYITDDFTSLKNTFGELADTLAEFSVNKDKVGGDK